MDSSGEEQISLKEELKNAESYINLEKLRFNEQIALKINIDKSIDTAHIRIVQFLFQPLLGNIFKHAFKNKTDKPQINFSIKDQGTSIEFIISDNGIGTQGLSKQDLVQKSCSKGLKIVESQLNNHYPEAFSFELLSKAEPGCTWIISIDKSSLNK
jgi:LytS/YehU family sensor histidine kinase